MKVSEIRIYPIKSTHPVHLNQSQVLHAGLEYDRHWALFDQSGQALTARDYPQLLDIACQMSDTEMIIKCGNKAIGSIAISEKDDIIESLKVHSYNAFGHHVNKKLDYWFSNYLSTSCRLMRVDFSNKRMVLGKHGGEKDDIVGFNDQAPILILSEESLHDLDSRLSGQMTIDRFRPNIIVKGCDPYAEDNWRQIKIGSVPFRVIQQCERCVFTTIDPLTKIRHPEGEPLSTLSTYRKGPGGGVVLGVHAVPIETGTIYLSDKIQVIESVIRPVG